MRYHFIVNGYLPDCKKQMQEQAGFAKRYLAEMEEGEMIVLGQTSELLDKIGRYHTKEAVLLKADRYVPELFLSAIAAQMTREDLYIFGSDYSGTELCVRAAYRAKGSSATAVHAMESLSVKRMVYANHMEGTFGLEQGPYCISLAKGMDREELIEEPLELQKSVDCTEGADHIVSAQFFPQEEEQGLEDAKILVAAGRGIKKKENIEVLEKLAESLGGEVGVSRPAAMNAWAPMNKLIGVSGAMAGPDICITAGVSGAAAFYAGIEKSKFIAAINTDEKAPIMKMADVAIVDDFMPVLEELEKLVK